MNCINCNEYLGLETETIQELTTLEIHTLCNMCYNHIYGDTELNNIQITDLQLAELAQFLKDHYEEFEHQNKPLEKIAEYIISMVDDNNE